MRRIPQTIPASYDINSGWDSQVPIRLLEDTMRTIQSFILALGLTGSLVACMPTGFLASKNTNSQSTATDDPKTQSNDRPTETGAGVPGYLVNCSDINAAGELVQVGCSVTTLDGTRVKATAETWTRYEMKLSPNANPGIVVSRLMAGSDDPWDVIFNFTGAPLNELRAAAQASTYSYSYPNEKGETVIAESPPPPVVATKPAATQTQNCDGVVVEGVCMVSVFRSCTDYCTESQMKVHPWVVERFGAGIEGNRQACADLYEKFPDRIPLPINSGVTDIVTGRGFGCHRSATGRTFFDTSTTDPSSSPYFGYSRICACQ
jgi:hypothetical protein